MYRDLILSAFGIFVSALFAYYPPLSTWFYTQVQEQYRGLVMVGVCLLVTLGLYGLGCAGVLSGVTCSPDTLKQLLVDFGALLVSNQITWKLLPTPAAKKVQ